jgi:hypothetical protein
MSVERKEWSSTATPKYFSASADLAKFNFTGFTASLTLIDISIKGEVMQAIGARQTLVVCDDKKAWNSDKIFEKIACLGVEKKEVAVKQEDLNTVKNDIINLLCSKGVITSEEAATHTNS